MKKIIVEHLKRYPDMQIQDMVKLLYQSEFGNGHMVSDPEDTLKLLKQEYSTVVGSRSEVSPAVEAIGGDYCRVYLNQLPQGLTLETLNKIFVLSTHRAGSDQRQFEEKLELLQQCVREGLCDWNEQDVAEYLERYREQEYPVVSHTESYRQKYHPSYRVISEDYAAWLHVFADIDQFLGGTDEAPVLAAIDGQCASGKTTLAELIRQVYDCNVFHMDDFFLRPEQRTPQRLAEVGGNVDYERFREEVLTPLDSGRPFTYQVYDCRTQTLAKVEDVPVKRLNIVEGAYSRHPYFGSCYHLEYCLTIDQNEQRNRILKRNGADMLRRFESEWIPMENAYLTKFGIAKL